MFFRNSLTHHHSSLRFCVCLRVVFSALILFLFFAGNQGPQITGLASNTGTGDVIWQNTTNAANDTVSATFASCSLGSGQVSYYLKTTYFHFTIPDTATITGVVVRYDRYSSNNSGTVSDSSVRLVKGGTITGDDKKGSNDWNTESERIDSYGGVSTMWGIQLSPSDVNSNTNFGVAISVTNLTDDGEAAYINWVTMTVYYSSSGSGGTNRSHKIKIFGQESTIHFGSPGVPVVRTFEVLTPAA